MTDYNESLTETCTAADAPVVAFTAVCFRTEASSVAAVATTTWSTSDSLADLATFSDSPTVTWVMIVAEGLGLSDTGGVTFVYQPNATAEELITFADALTAQGQYVATASDIIDLSDIAGLSWPVLVAETLGLHLTDTHSLGITLAETLRIVDAATGLGNYQIALAENVRFTDLASWFFSAEIAENLGIASDQLYVLSANLTASDVLALADVVTPQLFISVTASDSLTLNDDHILQSIYNQTVAEELIIRAGYVAPNGTFTAWAVNTRTGNVTEYGNYTFNSFSKIGNQYVAAASDGLYELLGDTDDGESIIADIKSGLFQFGGVHLSAIEAAYLGMRATGQFLLKLETGDGREYTYSLDANDMRTTKVLFGKGLRSRYYSWELVSTGQDFDLESIEFIPLINKRRV